MYRILLLLFAIAVRSDDSFYNSEDYIQEHSVGDDEGYGLNNWEHIHSLVGEKRVSKTRGTKKSFTADEFIVENLVEYDSIPGKGGKDYPTYSVIPATSFQCKQRIPGYYADQETNCQVFHVCSPSGEKVSFLCPNGSIFNQRYLVCSWWYDFDCRMVENFYVTPEPFFDIFQGSPNLYYNQETAASPEENYELQPVHDTNPRGFDLHTAHSGGNTRQEDRRSGFQNSTYTTDRQPVSEISSVMWNLNSSGRPVAFHLETPRGRNVSKINEKQ